MENSVRTKFYEKVEFMPGGCWHWTGTKTKVGYGMTTVFGKSEGAHRASYKIFTGELPEGYHVHHLCKNRICVNPAHLQAMSAFDHYNCRESRWLHPNFYYPYALKMVTHCIHGHEFTRENTGGTDNKRVCLTCAQLRREGKI